MNQTDKIKVSVIVVTYNQEKTIGRTLDSILEQKRDFPIEIIIGDDASSDNTEKICRDYSARYPDIIRYFRNGSNKGVRDNYFDCLLEARGEYIADVAGDDFWIYKDKLQLQSDTLDKNQDVSLVCTDWKYYDEDSRKLYSPWTDGHYPYKDIFGQADLTLHLLSHLNPIPVHLCTALYRKDSFLKLYEEHPAVFRNKEYLMEDFQLTVLLSMTGRFYFLDIPTLAYSINHDSITGTADFMKLFDFYYSSLSLTHRLAEITGTPHKKLEEVYRRLSHHTVMMAFHGRDKARMEKIRRLIKDKNFSINPKTKIILALSSIRLLSPRL